VPKEVRPINRFTNRGASTMVAKRVVRIGQEAFVLSPDGEGVVCTMVAKIDGNCYRFLNGSDGRRCPHWFSFKEAIAEASARISARQVALRKELRALARKRRTLETRDYEDDVRNAPYRVVDLRDTASLDSARLRRPRNLKKVRVPKVYLAPGYVVYAIITPMTHSEPGWEVYRPHKHFVLETEVRSVCFSPDGRAHYAFSTHFIVEEFSLSREEAEVRLQSFSEPGTKESVPFVSSEQEKKVLADLDADIPF